MSSASGFFGTQGVMPAAISDGSQAATYTNRSDPKANALYDFLGMPNRMAPIDAYSHRPRTNQTLLDAYEGRNAFLSDTIEGFILADNEPYTLFFLPWVYTDEKHFKFNTIEFNRALPGPTPHEGTSRLIVSSSSSQQFTSQRYGIKFRMEGDFAETAQGQAAYNRNLIQMSQSVQELANYGCEEALLSCKRYNKEYSAQHRERGLEWRRVLINEADDFAAASVDPNHLERIIERNREVFNARRIAPDTLLGPPGFKLFLSMESYGARTSYEVFGELGQSIFMDGPRAAGVLRDLVVFESREFDLNTGGPAVLPLERPTTVGEAYPMAWGDRRGEVLGKGKAGPYFTNQRDIYIYDLPANDFKRVSFAKAFLYSGVFMNADYAYQPDVTFGEIADVNNAELRNPATAAAHEEEMATYRTQAQLMDNMGGEEKPMRRLPMFISHDVTPGQLSYFVPRIMGQFDMDVINTSDFVQVAQSIANHPRGPQAILDELEDCVLGARFAMTTFEGGVELTSKVQGGAPPNFKAFSSSSPANVLNMNNSKAALLWGALPVAAAMEAMTYSPIEAGKLKVAPVDNKFGMWLGKVQSDAAAAGADNKAFKEAMERRRRVFVTLSRVYGTASSANILTVRGMVAKAFDDNVKASGDYKSGKSYATLDKDLNEVKNQASNARPASDTAASATLFKYTDDMLVNPFITNAPLEKLSDAQQKKLAAAFDAYVKANDPMEERIILHGKGEVFDAREPAKWLQAVQESGVDQNALRTTKAVVTDFAKAHAALEKAVDSILPGAKTIASSGAADSSMLGLGFAGGEEDNAFLPQEAFLKPSGPGAEIGARANRTERGAYVYRISQAALAKVPADLRAIYETVLRIKNTRDCWMKLIDLNVHVPINLLLWRLWIRNRMFTAIMFRSGLETGGTIYGHANFVISGEGATKTLEAHLTFNYASIVWGEKGVLHMPNVIPRGYLGGWNCEFIKDRNEVFEVAEEERGSIIVSAEPITENCWEWPVNFVPKQRIIDSARGSQSTYKDKVNLYGTHSSAAFVERLWGLNDSVAFSEAYDSYSTQYKVPNTIAHLGKHFVFSPATGAFNRMKQGWGHLSGNRTGRGAASVWEGNHKQFPDQDKIQYNLG